MEKGIELYENLKEIYPNILLISISLILCILGGISLAYQERYYQLIREKEYEEARDCKNITFSFKIFLIVLSALFSALVIEAEDVNSALTIIAIAGGLLSIISAFDSKYNEENEFELKISEEKKQMDEERKQMLKIKSNRKRLRG